MRLGNKIIRYGFIIVACLVIVFTVVNVWQRQGFGAESQAYKSEKLFYGALERQMSLTGITCVIEQSQKQKLFRQEISLSLADKPQARSITTISHSQLSVTTEELILPSGTYIRYTNIQPAASFTNVLNIWSKSKVDEPGRQDTLSATRLGNCVTPIANISNHKAKELIEKAKTSQVFHANYSKSYRQRLDGRLMQVYDVTIEPYPYVVFMKQVAAASDIKALDSEEPASFAERKPARLQYFIDTGSGRIHKISDIVQQRDIYFRGIGKQTDMTAPRNYIFQADLESRFKKIHDAMRP